MYDCIRGSHVENLGHPTIMFRCILDDTSTLTYIFSTFIQNDFLRLLVSRTDMMI